MDPREARKQAFLKRQQAGKQVSSGMGLGFFRADLQGVKFFQCKEADHDMDIIPYLAGPNDPDTPEGEWTYVLEVYEHRDVGGIEGQSYICMSKTYKQPCPVCEHRQTLIKEAADEDVIKDLRPSRYPRSIYNILCYDPGEEEKGIQVFHTSHYIMEMHLLKLAESSKRDIEQGHPPYKFFADPEEGWSVRFTRTGQGLNTRYIGHQLVQRNYTIPQETLDAAYQLDTLIHIPTYDEVYKAFWGEELGEAGASAPAPGPVATSPRGSVRGATPAAQPAAPPQPDDQYAAEQAGDYVCPGGGTFGVDTYNLQHCESCELWEPCVQENQALGQEQAGAYEEPPAPEQQPQQPAPAQAGRSAAPPARGGGRTTAAQPAGRPAPAATGSGPATGRGRGGGAPAGPARGGRGAAPAGRGGGRGGARPQPQAQTDNRRPAGRTLR